MVVAKEIQNQFKILSNLDGGSEFYVDEEIEIKD